METKKRFGFKELIAMSLPCVVLGVLAIVWQNNKAPKKLSVKSIEFQMPEPRDMKQGYNRRIVITPQLIAAPEVPNAKHVGEDFSISQVQFVSLENKVSSVLKKVKQRSFSTTVGEIKGKFFHTTAQRIIIVFNDENFPTGKTVVRANLYQDFVYNLHNGANFVRPIWRKISIPIVIEIPKPNANPELE